MHDYREVWKNFTESTSSCVEQTQLCQAAVKLVAHTFQVLSVSVWLVDEKKENLALAASTSLSEDSGNRLTPQGIDAVEVIHALQNHPEPVDIDASKENWAAALQRCHPDKFDKGGSRICVPIIAGGGDVLGLMVLGDRVSGVPFLQQDFDLLKCVGDQIAAGLRNLQLSQKLLRSKELEAFQTMSVFFVHDLKNTASTLSLMLQNMSVHYDDPAFKEDALRGISKSVNHINDLINRLTLFRKENAIEMTYSELNDLVESILSDLQVPSHIKIAKELRPLPKQRFNPEQIQKVVTNLILNAQQSINGQGEIRVETERQNGWVLLSVSDNGCGMSREFVDGSLFRPFQTTKKNGIGIGMFQSKMIIEAHGGKIEVETQIGRGTTFRVLLPFSPEVK
jgi:putative PEP-CTERM system histidine kinase